MKTILRYIIAYIIYALRSSVIKKRSYKITLKLETRSHKRNLKRTDLKYTLEFKSIASGLSSPFIYFFFRSGGLEIVSTHYFYFLIYFWIYYLFVSFSSLRQNLFMITNANNINFHSTKVYIYYYYIFSTTNANKD